MVFYVILFLFFLSALFLNTGGRIAGSDETAFFLETQSLAEQFSLAIPDTIINNGAYGADGRYYLGAGIGYTLVSVPFYLIGKIAVTVFQFPDEYALLIVKFFFSLTNVFIGALTGVFFLRLVLLFGLRQKTAFLMALILLFTTNYFVYTKSSMREPLLCLLLILILYYLIKYKSERKSRYLHFTGILCVLLIHTKVTFAVIFPVCVLYVMFVQADQVKWSVIQNFFRNKEAKNSFFIISIWGAIALLLVFLYNYLIFGNIFSSGYSQRNQSFTNPLFAGLYGLLFSSGKSLFLYAPVTALVFFSIGRFYSRFKAETCFMIIVFGVITVIHAKFFAWAGDGSWGPRYLLPAVPFLILLTGFTVESVITGVNRIKLFLFYALCITGFLIQLGGSAVYFGSYLRHIGEYPYQREFSDPEFLYKSHYIPNYSPATGHWELLFESVKKHVNGDMKNFTLQDTGRRLPLSANDQKRIVYIIDFWFMYAYYTNINGFAILAALTVLITAGVFLGIKTFSLINKPRTHAPNTDIGNSPGLQ